MFKKILEMIGMNYDENEELNDEYEPPRRNIQIKTQPIEPTLTDDGNRKIVNIFGGGRREEGGKMRVSSVSIIRPKTFEDSSLIADSIKEKKVVTFSLEFLGFDVGQRVLDFVSGTSYAMDSQLTKITDKVFTVIPSGIGYEDMDEDFFDDREV